MPIIKSAKKRVKLAAKANTRNSRTRRDMSEAVKAFNKALEGGKTAEIAKFQKAAVSSIDIAAKKNVIHKNKAARKKAQLSAKAKTAGVKPAKAPVKKTTAKPALKKAPVKKPAAKKKSS